MEKELFEFSDEEKLLKQTARDIAERYLRPLVPKAWQLEPDEALAIEAFGHLARFASLGIPEQYGGADGTTKQGEILTEELSRVDAALPLALGVTASLFGLPILLFGTEEQKKFFLSKIAAGELRGCYLQTTPEAGSDVASIDTIAVEKNGKWYITGSKRFISAGSIAHWGLVLAHTDPKKRNARWNDPERYSDLTMFLVNLERAKNTTPRQVTVVRNEIKAGMHASPTTEFALDECMADGILGNPREGWKMAMLTLASSRASGIAGQAIGCMRGAYEAAKKYCENRNQFSVKLADLPVTKEKLAWMKTMIEMAQLLAWRACNSRDRLPNDQRPWEAEASMAKLFASEMGERVTSEAMQRCGGAAYIMEVAPNTSIAKFWHDARLIKIYEGTSDIQELVICRRAIFSPLLKLTTQKGLENTWVLLKNPWSQAYWSFANNTEEEAFAKRMKGCGAWKPYEELQRLREEFVDLVKLTTEKVPPDPQKPTLPSPWFHIAWALTVLEGAKLIIWKEVYTNPQWRDPPISSIPATPIEVKLAIAEAKCALHDAKLSLETPFGYTN